MPLSTTSPLALAYLGDCVIEIFVRERLVLTGVSDTGRLSEASRAYVAACAQSAAVTRLIDAQLLTEDEQAAYRRGKNAKTPGVPKHQSAVDYRKATGFESLMGWLYQAGQIDRCRQLFEAAYAPQLEKMRQNPAL